VSTLNNTETEIDFLQKLQQPHPSTEKQKDASGGGAPFSFPVKGRGCWRFCRKSISISVLFKVLTGGST
jgi:hypothetical protein